MGHIFAKKLIWIGLAVGILFWGVESAIHVFIFREGSFYLQIFRPELHEIWMRLLFVIFFVVFGFFSQYVVDKTSQQEETIKFAHDELNQIFNTAADGMRVIDKDNTVLRANKTFLELSGVSIEDTIGKKCYAIFHGEMCRTKNCPLFRVMAGEKKVESFVLKERCDMKKVSCIVTATPFRNTKGEIIGIVEDFRDVTEYKKAEEKSETLNKELVEANKKLKELTLRDSNTGLYNQRYLEEIIEAEFNRAKRFVLPFSVMMIDIDYFKSINDVYGHLFGDLILRQLSGKLKQIVRKYDSVIRLGGEEFVIVSPATDRAQALILARRLLEEVNIACFGDNKHTVRLRLSIAVVSCFDHNIRCGMELVSIADQILNKIKEDGGNKVYSFENVKGKVLVLGGRDQDAKDIESVKGKIFKLTRRANQSVAETVFALAKTMKLRDYYTQKQAEEIVKYAEKIAEKINLSGNETKNVKHAAILHDLGKIGISEKILLKEGRLTREEYEDIKRHPRISADIIEPIYFLQAALPLILYHHEKWNGEGSFYGLKGEQIPLGARIIRIVEDYEALISDRPYRKAYPKHQAIDIIKTQSNTHFDPQLTTALLDILLQEN